MVVLSWFVLLSWVTSIGLLSFTAVILLLLGVAFAIAGLSTVAVLTIRKLRRREPPGHGKHPALYLTAALLAGGLIQPFQPWPFRLRFELSRHALDAFADHPIEDGDPDTFRRGGGFMIYEVSVGGDNVFLIHHQGFIFDDAGMARLPGITPAIIEKEDYTPRGGDWYLFVRRIW